MGEPRREVVEALVDEHFVPRTGGMACSLSRDAVVVLFLHAMDTIGVSPLERAARDECAAREVISALRALAEDCTEMTAPEPEVGLYGRAPCYVSLEEPTDAWCSPCRTRRANRAAYRQAMRDRSAARRRMMYHYRALNGGDDG